jgi:Glycosyl transferase family 2
VSASGKAGSYVLPFRSGAEGEVEELAEYLRSVSGLAEVLVVDGSPPREFRRNAKRLTGTVRHLPPDGGLDYGMAKVNGVITGVREARHETVVIADDDVRYEPEVLRELFSRLESAELVVPQNYFSPLPWHARWDTARTLLNRVCTGDRWFPAGDFPGTLAVRRSFFLGIDAYDGDVIFENLELMRTVRAAGGEVQIALDLYVRRLPPTARHFLSQRVRQAYDDFAIPLRMAGFLSLGPLLAGLGLVRRPRVAATLAFAPIVAAEVGRRRKGGTAVYPASGSLMAPAWVAERAVCSWLALGQRVFRGGTTYRGTVISRAATSPAALARRYRRRPAGSAPRPPRAGAAYDDRPLGASKRMTL